MQSNLLVEAKRAAEAFDLARRNHNDEEAERAGRSFLDHMMSLENPLPEEANTIADPSVSASGASGGPDFDEERARLMRKKEEVEEYFRGMTGKEAKP